MPSESRSRITLKTRRLIAENQVFDVYFDHIVEDGGAEVPAYLVVAPKAVSEDLVTGASVLPVTEGRIGLLRLYRHAIGELTWEVPRGFVEAGESPGDAAARELEEEAGLIVDKDNLIDAGRMTPEAGVLAARVALYIAQDCRRVREYAADELGHTDFVWFSIDEALDMAHGAQIQDPSTLLLIHRFALDRSRRGR